MYPTIVFTTDDGRMLGKVEGQRNADQIKTAYNVYKHSEKYNSQK